MGNRILYTSVCVLIILLINTSPVLAQRTGVNLSGYSVYVESFGRKVKESYGLKVIHPYAFSLRTIQQSMASLIYKEKSILGSEKRRLFKNEFIKKIAPEIETKFREADSDQKVSFEIFSRSGKKYIKGDTFLTPQGLNWRFSILRWEKRSLDTSDSIGDPWALIPQEDQAYMKWYWKKSKRVSQDITNWIILKKVLPVSSKTLPALKPADSRQQKKSNPKDSATEVKDRLIGIEKLWKEKIITDEEYKAKRKEILGEL